MGDEGVAAWKFPLIVSAIAISIVGGFYLGGPGLGMAVGALAAATIVVEAVRHPPRRPISPPSAPDSRRHVLVVVDSPLEGPAVDRLSELVCDPTELVAPEVLLLAPSRHRFLDRWASDLDPGRHAAQRNLVISAASLAAAGVAANARVGDEDLVQMVEDELRTFPATDVVLVTEDRRRVAAASPADELRARLETGLRTISIEVPVAVEAPVEGWGAPGRGTRYP
jgi:hypothetical protein